MAGNSYIKIVAPDRVADHQLDGFKHRVAHDFDAARRKAGAVIESFTTDRTYGERVFALKIRGEMNPNQEKVIGQFRFG